MRRAAPTLAISPKLLKHFAAATVTITLLLALFATDEDWGARAQLEANRAENQLAAAEAEKLGTRKLASKLKVREPSGGGFGSDEGGGGGGGTWYPNKSTANAERPNLRTTGIPQLEQRPGATLTVTGVDLEDALEQDPRKRKRKTGEQFRPNSEQIDKIKANSRQRTGGGSQGGD
ncbi:MAG: hypothetical protein KGZ65_06610 [Sphingomonadales bacterium]|nr:hypothetical protein [Sphingomonadales bacterium]